MKLLSVSYVCHVARCSDRPSFNVSFFLKCRGILMKFINTQFYLSCCQFFPEIYVGTHNTWTSGPLRGELPSTLTNERFKVLKNAFKI